MGRQWPGSVINAQRCLTALLVLMGLGTLLTILFEDELILAWAERNPGAREILQEGGIPALRDSSIAVPAFVPVAVVLFIVVLGLVEVLRVFFRGGYEWARMSLVGVALVAGLGASLIAFREHPPTVFVVVSIVTLVDVVALLVFLLHPDTTRFVRGAWLVHHDVPSEALASDDPD